MDHSDIKNCLAEIELRLNWGTSSAWTNQDFELLSEKIFDKTGVNLSITTLKRIWGKVDYQSSPSTSTLNVLAQYLGFEHWRDFQNKSKGSTVIEKSPKRSKKSWIFKGFKNPKVVVAIIVLLAVSSLFFLIDRRQVFFKADEVVFQSRIVTVGLPNTVVFDYDVSKVIADSFHIQQSWDRRRRVRVSPDDTQHTSFYYYPGFFHAKLIANDQIIKEHEVFVESDGWIGMIERFPEPIYIPNYITSANGYLSLDNKKYAKSEDHFQDKDYWADYYFVKDFGDIDANNFSYACRVRNNSEFGSVCNESRISIICTQGRYNIPLCQPGCVSKINLTLSDKYLQGKRSDLSSLGCDLSDWIDFRLEVVDKKCDIFINNKLKFTQEYTYDPGRIVGFKFKFNGNGEVDHVQLSRSDNSIVFEESFNQPI